MQLIPKPISDLLSQDIDINNDEQQELLTTNLVESIVQSEEYFPAEKADKLIWVVNMFQKEQAYWKEKIEIARKYFISMEKMEERLKAYIRMIMVDEESWFGNDQKIVAKDYKKSIVDEGMLSKEEFVYSIKGLSKEQYDLLILALTFSPNTELVSFIESNTEMKPFGVTKLGEDHPAVMKQTKRLIQIKDLSQKDLKGQR